MCGRLDNLNYSPAFFIFVLMSMPGLYLLYLPYIQSSATVKKSTIDYSSGSGNQIQKENVLSTASVQNRGLVSNRVTPSNTISSILHNPGQTSNHVETMDNKKQKKPSIPPPGMIIVETRKGPMKIHDSFKICQPHGRVPLMSNNTNQDIYSTYMGCLQLNFRQLEFPITTKTKSWKHCQSHCQAVRFKYFAFGDIANTKSSCVCLLHLPLESLRCPAINSTCSEKWPCSSSSTLFHLYFLGSYPPQPAKSDITHQQRQSIQRNHVDVYLFVHERIGCLWHTCRLANFSTRFEYHIYDMRFQLTQEDMIHHILPSRPGPKIIVLNSCCVSDELLLNWPTEAILVVAADETARWGFAHPNGRNWWGPHGPHGSLPSDSNRNMILPNATNPWFKQYYSTKHVEVYGDNVHFLPLGSRVEFPDPNKQHIPATLRKYIYSFMGAATNSQRRQLVDIMQRDTLIPKERVSR